MTTDPKLASLVGGRAYVTRGRAVLRESDSGPGFERVGRLPAPTHLRDRLSTGRATGRAVATVVGAFPTSNVWPATADPVDADDPNPDGRALVATTARAVHASDDGGRTWTRRRRLPASGTAGALPSACCVADGRCYLGEYPLDGATPRILVSDDGRRFDVLARLPGVRHVHAIQRDPYTGDVWVTTGDRDAECAIGRLVDGAVRPVGAGSQSWRAVELAFAPSAVLWGVDSAYADANRLYRLDREAIPGREREYERENEDGFGAESGRDGVAGPTADAAADVVATVDGSVYYAATATVDGRRYVAFSTAAETTPDSTAPADASTGASAGKTGSDVARVVAASSATGFTEWVELARYRKRRVPADVVPIGSANAYVFLAVSDDRGLFVNPYNTRRHAGTIRRLPPATLAARVDGAGAREIDDDPGVGEGEGVRVGEGGDADAGTGEYDA